MKNINILELVKNELVGKKLKYRETIRTIYTHISVAYHKNGTTKKQLKNGFNVFYKSKEVPIGTYEIFDTQLIVDVRLNFCENDNYIGKSYDTNFKLLLENGVELEFDPEVEFKYIDPSTLMMYNI